jgi:arylformamidase
MRYANLTDAAINLQFMPRIAVPDHEVWLERESAMSAQARSRLAGARLDVRYGDGPLQTLDVFPAGSAGAPIQIFLHGGYWRALDKSFYSYVAGTLTPAGAATIVLNFDLCPAVSLDRVVRESLDGIAWTYRHARDFGGDPDRIHLSGNSAGAHLAAMAMAHDWRAEGVPADLVKGACCITGIYDLEPVLRIAANADIRLTPDMVARNSPLFLPPRMTGQVIVAVGGDEPELWIGQSRAYCSKLRDGGVDAELMVVADTHHFSVTQTLADADSPLTRAVRRQMGL